MCILPMLHRCAAFRGSKKIRITFPLLLLASLVAGMYGQQWHIDPQASEAERSFISRLTEHIKEDDGRVLNCRLNFAFVLFALQMIVFVGTEIQAALYGDASVMFFLVRFYEFLCGYAGYWIIGDLHHSTGPSCMFCSCSPSHKSAT